MNSLIKKMLVLALILFIGVKAYNKFTEPKQEVEVTKVETVHSVAAPESVSAAPNSAPAPTPSQTKNVAVNPNSTSSGAPHVPPAPPDLATVNAIQSEMSNAKVDAQVNKLEDGSYELNVTFHSIQQTYHLSQSVDANQVKANLSMNLNKKMGEVVNITVSGFEQMKSQVFNEYMDSLIAQDREVTERLRQRELLNPTQPE